MSAAFGMLVQHEARLALRDLLWMMTAGRRLRGLRLAVGLVVFIACLHGLSYLALTHGMRLVRGDGVAIYVSVSTSLLMAWTLMLSQAMESITRGFYTRGDLDLILASPIQPTRIFALRVTVNALLVSALSVMLVGPVVNVLAILDTPRWLAAYGVALGMGFSATALAVLLTVTLFHFAGPKRTRLIAQILAAIIGALFIIGIQVMAILQSGNLTRDAVLLAPALLAHAPALESAWWLPARAAMGDLHALALTLLGVGASYALIILPLLPRFASYTIAAATVVQRSLRAANHAAFRRTTPMQALRRKEWVLLLRDPWLLSQTLMQLLYLLPPALLLWKDFSAQSNGLLVIVPVLVMAAGQLAGGIAWITLSGEDAPDLIASAPLASAHILRAKRQTVGRAIAWIFLPFVIVLALASPWAAGVAASFICCAAWASTSIQLWFRRHAKRTQFRRRHTASRIATFSEAFCCVGWAGTAALVANQAWFAAGVPLVIAFAVLGVARSFRPRDL